MSASLQSFIDRIDQRNEDRENDSERLQLLSGMRVRSRWRWKFKNGRWRRNRKCEWREVAGPHIASFTGPALVRAADRQMTLLYKLHHGDVGGFRIPTDIYREMFRTAAASSGRSFLVGLEMLGLEKYGIPMSPYPCEVIEVVSKRAMNANERARPGEAGEGT